MFIVSPRILKLLAALVWHVGGIVLLIKGGSLLQEADALQPAQIWPWVAVMTALILGGLKAKFLFIKSCRRNLARITRLKRPRPWQFFRPGFFASLALMIAVGATLSRLAHGRYSFMLGVALLDVSIAVALLGSGIIFWRHKVRVLPLSLD